MRTKILIAGKIAELMGELRDRIVERFPEAGINQQAKVLQKWTLQAEKKARKLSGHSILFTMFSLSLIGVLLATSVYGVNRLHPELRTPSATELLHSLEAVCNIVLVLGGGTFWLLSSGKRWRIQRWNRELAAFRSFAFVIEALQMNKDADRLQRASNEDTHSSPKLGNHVRTAFLMTRYLNYCNEMLAIVGQVTAYYGQWIEEQAVLATVSEIGALTGQMRIAISSKIATLAPAVHQEQVEANRAAQATEHAKASVDPKNGEV